MLILINIHYPGPNFLPVFLKKSHSKHLYGGVENSFGYYLLTGKAVYLSPKLLGKPHNLWCRCRRMILKFLTSDSRCANHMTHIPTMILCSSVECHEQIVKSIFLSLSKIVLLEQKFHPHKQDG